MPHLLDLICFGLGASRLQIENLFHIVAGKNVMASSNAAFLKSQPQEKLAQIRKRNVGIRDSAQYLFEHLFGLNHRASSPAGSILQALYGTLKEV